MPLRYGFFPTDSTAGHLVEHKEDRKKLYKWGNELRQTYRTLAQEAGVSELDVHLLMNHSLPGVNAGYITRHKLLEGHLRSTQEKISGLILSKAAQVGKMRASPELAWFKQSRLLAIKSHGGVSPRLALAA